MSLPTTSSRIRRTRPPEGRPRAGLENRPDPTGEPVPRPNGQLGTDLLAIAMGLLGVLLALALYRPGSAGVAGAFLLSFLRIWMGTVVHVAPVLFIGGALGLALDHRRATNPQMVLGVAGLLVMGFGWVHLLATGSAAPFDSTGARFHHLFDWSRHAAALVERPDGGLFGALIMTLLTPLGRAGSFITLGAMGLASVLLITELTLRTIYERLHERSRIAAERARHHARNAGAKARKVAAGLPALPARRQQDLFLDVDEEADAGRPAPKEEERRGLGFFRRRPETPATIREEAPQPVKRESALVPVDPPLPFEDEEMVGASGQARAPVGEARRAVPQRTRPKPGRPGAPANPTGEYVLPPLDLLEATVPRPKQKTSEAESNIAILESTLGQFRIEAQVVEIADGPSVTRYEIRLGEGIRVKKILDLADNIAMSLAAMSVRVEAPIPGKAAIGIEVPKKATCVVNLRECLESNEARDLASRVGFVLGRDVGDEVRCADLAKMPHLLVAGATNSGKSVCLNVLIASLLFRARPDELKLIMIDPKRVELTLFDGIPHLIHPVVKDVKQAAGILRWVLKEMDHRYDMFAHVMTRNLEGYNDKMAKEPGKRLPYIVVIIDELADLMMQQGPEVEQSICRLAQLARATGIHLVIATQRPSVDVITGLIKSNIPSRISFAVSSQIDSRTILDGKGAESLIGRGDMLFKPVDANKPTRIQGAFLRESEVERLVNYLKSQGKPEYIAEAMGVDQGNYGTPIQEETEDDLFEPAARFIVTTGHASTSMIQRKFKIGYTRAARLVDLMQSRGIVGALDGAKPREILMSRDSLDGMFRNARNSLYGGLGPAEEEYDEPADGADGEGPFVEE